ncbi:MAG TPA: GNAT family N-acetyltransferase [Candidatus Limnocylindria bacterium]|nr:GNAT family N-acetyltransferase [Candidatus Limnocylindria bacterium]
MPPLQTERLIVRPFEEGDLEAVLAVLEVHDAAGREATERYVRHGALNAVVLAELGQPPYGDRAVVLRDSGELVGLAGLVPAYGPFDQLRPVESGRDRSAPRTHDRPEVGLFYHLHTERRGRGYATEAARALVDFAFGPLRVYRIVATTERDNAASQAVMGHLGMTLHENPLDEPAWFQIVGILDNEGR